MKVIEKEGKTTSKIIESFMLEHNVQLNDLKFEVIQEGSSSFFSMFSSKKAKVKFFLPDTADVLRKYIEDLLIKLGTKAEDIKIVQDGDNYRIDLLKVPDAGFLIGKDAKLLDSLQHIINQMINKHEKKHFRVYLDVDGYRERKEESLVKKVKSIASKVKQRKKSITLEPLPAAKRKIVHQLVEKDPTIRTMTIGEGTYKRVVIMPNSKIKPNNNRPKSNYTKNNGPRKNKKASNSSS